MQSLESTRLKSAALNTAFLADAQAAPPLPVTSPAVFGFPRNSRVSYALTMTTIMCDNTSIVQDIRTIFHILLSLLPPAFIRYLLFFIFLPHTLSLLFPAASPFYFVFYHLTMPFFSCFWFNFRPLLYGILPYFLFFFAQYSWRIALEAVWHIIKEEKSNLANMGVHHWRSCTTCARAPA